MICFEGSNQNDPTLVDVLVSQSKVFVEQFLAELDITLTDVVNSGGHSVPRTHKPANWPTGDSQPIGRLLINQLLSRLRAMPNVQLLSNSRVIRLLSQETTLPCGTTDTQVTGLVYVNSSTEIQLLAKTVVICTGGYMADRRGNSLLAEHTADMCSMATASGKHADGEGQKMVRAIGGELINMRNVQLDACGIINQVKILGSRFLISL